MLYRMRHSIFYFRDQSSHHGVLWLSHKGQSIKPQDTCGTMLRFVQVTDREIKVT